MTTYFITACAHMHQNLFQRDEVANLLVATLFRYRDAGEFQLHEYVVMPDHIHVLLSLDDQRALGRAVQLVKGGFSHALREAGISLRAVWQPGYHDRRVRDEGEHAEFARYIRENPVRKKLVNDASKYPFSSASTEKVGKIQPGLKPRVIKKEALTPA
jgi:putative transposase